MPSVSPAGISLPERYRVVRHLASGGMASVWEAHDEILARDVAVKILAPHLGEDARARKRFQREARAAAGLSSHPNVVTVYDVGEHRDRVFMVMEIMRGGSVTDRLRSGREIDHATALRWLREAASALDAAHDAGIVHRDVKPANLLLDERERLAIADFGIARLAWEEQVTATGQVLGTAAYISPEQALGEPATAASDRYSLAVVAFELLTGTRPFEADHFAAQARAHVEDPPPPPSVRASELSPQVDDVVERGLAKEPGDRWPSSEAFVDALEHALGGRRRQAAGPATATTRRIETPPAAAPRARHGEDAGGGAAAPRARHAEGAGGRAAAPGARHAEGAGGRAAPRARHAAPRRAEGRRRSGAAALLAGLAGLLALAVLGVVLLASGGDSGGERRASTPSPSPTAERTRTATPTPSPTQTRTATATPSATQTAAPPAGGNPADLERQGHQLLQANKPQEAVPVLQQAVQACQGSNQVDPCAYAMYDYAVALVQSGRPQDAIPVLQERLQRFDNQNGTVKALLRKAQKDAGKKPGKRGKGHSEGD